ncbi:hypothetical protein SLV14_001549 [Streptomyces sp. Je 1-4]|uniref:hypothetical protein n=1 Tax=Streptomyces TaxID=1883 RepID=UPI0021D9B4F3|nr:MULTISPECIES: hypothetical protein [unclassified Streptomyces]UYB39100.1 hypothetical protein SLV14_001549 [Streptomyces sp. Je 1-4]UZQ35105.1 hypothetical protein SLV14N_001549 [Streptomyces sp. Je 1-4] [Streptomyces sp. Je 1-4 4N24]UZQ42523.1 hypothetical protein SLV14NA_001549 [Streptomyces sp. Je 1-4] [Streptomyces sp. Je 1-4 4N24_ara]
MTYADEAHAAIVPLLALQEQFQSDLSLEEGGFNWWQDFALSAGRRILISDYLMSLPSSVETNLVEAVMHAHKLKELRYAEGVRWRQRLRQRTDTQGWLERNERDLDRDVEGSAHLAGFFRCVGSVIDNLAGLVIGVAGLRVKIPRADAGSLRMDRDSADGLATDGPPRELQLELVRAMKGAIRDGPEGWWEWADDLRNTLVHRARRFEASMYDGNEDNAMVCPLPRHPKQTDAEARARSGRQLGEYLDEDGEVTIAGILKVTIEVTRATTSAAVKTWERRRREPGLVPQPFEQWPEMKQGREVAFAGCNPTGLPRQRAGSMLLMHPNRTRRLAAGKLTDPDLHVWKDWLTE